MIELLTATGRTGPAPLRIPLNAQYFSGISTWQRERFNTARGNALSAQPDIDAKKSS